MSSVKLIEKNYVTPTISFLKRSQFTSQSKSLSKSIMGKSNEFIKEKENFQIKKISLLKLKTNKSNIPLPKYINPEITSVIQNGQNIIKENKLRKSNENTKSQSSIKNSLYKHTKTKSYNLTESSYLDSMKNILDSKNIIKTKEEILEYKLKLEKLQNENNLFKEKQKTLNTILKGNEAKSEMLKKNYLEVIEFYKKENESLKNKLKSKNNIKKEEKNENSYLISTLNILLDLIEIFVSQKNSAIRDSVFKTNMENLSYSIDIYDSYNNEDERRITLIEQIQSIVLSKLKFIQIAMNMDLDKEIIKVKNWSNLFFKDFSYLNISNFSQIVKNSKKDYTSNFKERDGISIASSDPNSNSSKFFQSPKFYRNISFESLKNDNYSSKIKVFEMGKDENFSVRLNSSAQNDSLDFNGEAQFNTSFQNPSHLQTKKLFNSTLGSFRNNFNSNNSSVNLNLSDNKIMNINEIENGNIDYLSLGTSIFRNKTINLNDEPTDFNLTEICVDNNQNENKQENNQIILIPIVK